MSCCPDRVGMKKNKDWSYYKTVKNVRVNAGYVLHCLTQDPDVLRIMADVTARTGKTAWAECANVRHINAQVVECDLKVYVKVLVKPANAVTVKHNKSCHVASCPTKYILTYIDEDGDESEDSFCGSEDDLVQKMYNDFNRFGVKMVGLKSTFGTKSFHSVEVVKPGCFASEEDEYKYVQTNYEVVA